MGSGVFVAGVLVGLAVSIPLGWWTLARSLRRARLAERRARDAQRMAEIGAMTSGLAHEIKNPLSSIGLNAQLLAEQVGELGIDPEEASRLNRRVGALRREADRLRDILGDFLRFAGQIRLEKRPADLNLVVDELAEFYLPQAEQSGVRLRTDLAAQALEVDLDATHFKQALLNLLINATQAMTQPSAGGGAGAAKELIVRTERRRAPGGPVASVHVIDTGPGIPADRLPKIFTPYFTTKAGGSGLGLPTSRRLIEEHGGRIEVYSEVGRGSDFQITLPLRVRPAGASPDRASGEPVAPATP